jgi:hypothetical protein
MTSYITKRYAPLLTKYDVQMLFGWLKDAYGSIAKAARVTGVQRKTAYDWDALKEEVRLETKLKVLEQSMKLDENRAVQFLIRKTENNLKEILQHYLRHIYENSMEASSKEDFSKYIGIFHDIQQKHRGAVFDNQPGEVEEMNKVIRARAKEFQMDLAESPIQLIRPEVLADETIALLKIIRSNKYSIAEMKKMIALPPKFVDNICEVLHYLDPGKGIGREFETPPQPIADLQRDFDIIKNVGYPGLEQSLIIMQASRKEKVG